MAFIAVLILIWLATAGWKITFIAVLILIWLATAGRIMAFIAVLISAWFITRYFIINLVNRNLTIGYPAWFRKIRKNFLTYFQIIATLILLTFGECHLAIYGLITATARWFAASLHTLSIVSTNLRNKRIIFVVVDRRTLIGTMPNYLAVWWNIWKFRIVRAIWVLRNITVRFTFTLMNLYDLLIFGSVVWNVADLRSSQLLKYRFIFSSVFVLQNILLPDFFFTFIRVITAGCILSSSNNIRSLLSWSCIYWRWIWFLCSSYRNTLTFCCFRIEMIYISVCTKGIYISSLWSCQYFLCT